MAAKNQKWTESPFWDLLWFLFWWRGAVIGFSLLKYVSYSELDIRFRVVLACLGPVFAIMAINSLDEFTKSLTPSKYEQIPSKGFCRFTEVNQFWCNVRNWMAAGFAALTSLFAMLELLVGSQTVALNWFLGCLAAFMGFLWSVEYTRQHSGEFEVIVPEVPRRPYLPRCSHELPEDIQALIDDVRKLLDKSPESSS